MALKEKIRPPSQLEYPQITAGGYRFFQQIAERLNYGALFVPRKDPSAYDWVLAVLTTDGAYHTLDASPIIGLGATAVYLRVGITDDAAGSSIVIRKLGNSNEINALRAITQVANVAINVYGIVPVTNAGLFEYKAENLTWTAINIEVCGWFV